MQEHFSFKNEILDANFLQECCLGVNRRAPQS
jgi:hypothetical protein